VITVCDNANDTCPVFPGRAQRLHWSFEDPAAVDGPAEVRLSGFRDVRDPMRARIRGFSARHATQAPANPPGPAGFGTIGNRSCGSSG